MTFLTPPFSADRRIILGAASPRGLSPPWADARRLAEACTRCGDCIAACPEAILSRDAGGFPAVDFSRGECTFCAACATACGQGVFDDPSLPPWTIKATASANCLAHAGVVCQACKDACATGAIRFPPMVGSVSRPQIDAERCTGCGACLSPCPVKAISIHSPAGIHAAD